MTEGLILLQTLAKPFGRFRSLYTLAALGFRAGIAPLSALAEAPGLQMPCPRLLTAGEIETILARAKSLGAAERQPDDVFGAWILAEVDGLVYSISFLNCEEGVESCTTLQFRAIWNSEGAHTTEMMNAWNRDWRFAKAFINASGNATLEYDVSLAGGVTLANFSETLAWWVDLLAAFSETVIEPGYAAARVEKVEPRPAE